jgi:polyisoprenyl-teichoic acid--peptidoglycan teichoic acid transferase
VKSAGIRSVVFDDTVINPAYPDYPKIRALVQQALAPAPAATPSSSAPAPAPATPSAPLSAAPSPGGNGGSVTEVADACAYDPAQAQAALTAGQPPTRGG